MLAISTSALASSGVVGATQRFLVFVSTIDNFDAKMGAVETAIESAGDSEFAEVAALHVKLLTTPPEYPEQDS